MPTLSKEKLEELFNWLRQHDIQFNATKINRQFSDGVSLAILLKKLHPRLVELHNYPSQNSMQLKLSNWETLNAKVLVKLGLPQTKISLENLAKGSVGSIENLLLGIMLNERAIKAKKENDLLTAKRMENVLMNDEQIILIVINKKIGDAIVQVPQQMVLYSLYEKAILAVKERSKLLKAIENEVAIVEQDIQRLRKRIRTLLNQEKSISEKGLHTSDIIYLFEVINLRRVRNEFLEGLHGRHDRPLVPPLLLDDNITPRPMTLTETDRSRTSSSRTTTKTLTPKSLPLALPMGTSINNSNIFEASLKRKLKPSKIPTRNGQILRTEQEKLILREKLERQRSIQTLNDSVATKNTKFATSELNNKPLNAVYRELDKASLSKSSRTTATVTIMPKKAIRGSSSQSRTEVPPKANKASSRLTFLMNSCRKSAPKKPSISKIESSKKSNDPCKSTTSNPSPVSPTATSQYTPTKGAISSLLTHIKAINPQQIAKSALINNIQVKSTNKPNNKIVTHKGIMKTLPPLQKEESVTKNSKLPKLKRNNKNNDNNNQNNNINGTKIPKLTQGSNKNSNNNNSKISKQTQKESNATKNQQHEKDAIKPTSSPPKKSIFSYNRKQ